MKRLAALEACGSSNLACRSSRRRLGRPRPHPIVEIVAALRTAEFLSTEVRRVERVSALRADFAGAGFGLLPRDHSPIGRPAMLVAAKDLPHVVIERQRGAAIRAKVLERILTCVFDANGHYPRSSYSRGNRISWRSVATGCRRRGIYRRGEICCSYIRADPRSTAAFERRADRALDGQSRRLCRWLLTKAKTRDTGLSELRKPTTRSTRTRSGRRGAGL